MKKARWQATTGAYYTAKSKAWVKCAGAINKNAGSGLVRQAGAWVYKARALGAFGGILSLRGAELASRIKGASAKASERASSQSASSLWPRKRASPAGVEGDPGRPFPEAESMGYGAQSPGSEPSSASSLQSSAWPRAAAACMAVHSPGRAFARGSAPAFKRARAAFGKSKWQAQSKGVSPWAPRASRSAPALANARQHLL